MTLVYMAKLGLKIQSIDDEAQKIDDSIFKPFEIVLASFYINDKLGKSQFF